MKNINSLFYTYSLVAVIISGLAFTPAHTPTSTGFAEAPDLVVRAIKFPNGIKTGNCTDISVYITNSSITAIPGKFKVQIYVSPNGYPAETYNLVMGNIAGDKTKRVTFKDVPIPGKGQFKLEAQADISNSIQESSEYNNKKLIYPTTQGLCF